MVCRRRCAHRSCSSRGDEEESREEKNVAEAVLSWGRFVRMLRRIRARQRYFGLLGQLLQKNPASLRDHLISLWPKIELPP